MGAKHGGAARAARALLAMAAAALLSSCVNEPKTVCPVLGVLDTASSITKFPAGAAHEPANVAWQAEITGADLDCEYTTDLLDEMEVNMRIDMVGRKGPAARGGEADLEYFVVITDRSGTVVTKKVFPATIDFDGQRQAAITEEIWQLYRLKQGGAGALYEVWVGFQLTDVEVEFNRRNAI